MISATFPYEKKQREVLGWSMASVDEGQGDPIVILLKIRDLGVPLLSVQHLPLEETISTPSE